MVSLIPGYEYDIFISYRQKDNKHDGWVTEFVDNLKGELEATFKEDVSVYFDINPHDGLLETHDVDASLKEKLKCLIFIPIISQTYCDSKSFAWQHEFVAFNKMAKDDQFGRDIRLSGGNVASRILPAKIHDLDQEDKSLLENELGGILRSVDFIYRSSGVNRPLRASEDHPQDNLNKTYYRDQINKVANAVKEIITALRKHELHGGDNPKEVVETKSVNRRILKTKTVIASAIVLALIIIGYFLVPKLFKPSEPVEKSIAVLPFFNDSNDEENTHIINGIMDEVLKNLQTIKDLRVISRSSVEQFRSSTRPTIPEISKKLDANYIVEGSGQKYGNMIRLRIQLIDATHDKHLWAESYEKEIKETKDIFNIQSQIAESIASQLKIIMTPEEKQIINKISTKSLKAYDLYQRGREMYLKNFFEDVDTGAIKRAEYFYRKALEDDSAFAKAYAGLARVYRDKNTRKQSSYFSNNYLDSVLILANRALFYDEYLSEGYDIRAYYYIDTGQPEMAMRELETAIKYNPNDWEAYQNKAYLYSFDVNNLDCVKAIENLTKAICISKGKELPSLLRYLGQSYSVISGFFEKGNYYYEEAFKLDGNSFLYNYSLAFAECMGPGNYKKALEYFNNAYAIDSGDIDVLKDLGYCHMFLGQYGESFQYYKRCAQKLKTSGQLSIDYLHRIAFIYRQNGYKAEANEYINKQKIICEESIIKNRATAKDLTAYYDLAGVYSLMGKREKAFQNLRIWAKMPVFSVWWVTIIKKDPLFDSIRNEPEFQQIVRDMETKYQAEHERVRKWLEEQGML
jgi:TolB-like protein